MSDSAHVTSIDSIVAFAAALQSFEDDASRALLMIDEQAKGALQWLENDAPQYWREQIRVGYDNVARTRTALQTCRMRSVAGNRPACLEETEAHRAAQRKVRQAEEKVEVVRKWAQKVRHQMDEYRGRIMSLKRCLEGDLPQTIALLERTVATLDDYVEGQRGDAINDLPSPQTPGRPSESASAKETS